MDDQTLIWFYEYAKQRDCLETETSWDNRFVLSLTEEIIRLRNKYEGFGYEVD